MYSVWRNLGIYCRIIYEIEDMLGRGESVNKVIEVDEYMLCLRNE